MAEKDMDESDYMLAQVNIARMKAPVTDPVMEGFVARLDEINALAEASEGFIWRLKSDEEDGDQVVAFEKDGLLFNLSIWKDVEALRNFVYKTMHRELLAARGQWFDRMDTPHLALWWVPAGHLPSIDEALLRLDRLEMLGPSQNAFDFAQAFPQPVKVQNSDDTEEDA